MSARASVSVLRIGPGREYRTPQQYRHPIGMAAEGGRWGKRAWRAQARLVMRAEGAPEEQVTARPSLHGAVPVRPGRCCTAVWYAASGRAAASETAAGPDVYRDSAIQAVYIR